MAAGMTGRHHGGSALLCHFQAAVVFCLRHRMHRNQAGDRRRRGPKNRDDQHRQCARSRHSHSLPLFDLNDRMPFHCQSGSDSNHTCSTRRLLGGHLGIVYSSDFAVGCHSFWFGYPLCAGNILLTLPHQTSDSYRIASSLLRWIRVLFRSLAREI
jgi:hypothetical protein